MVAAQCGTAKAVPFVQKVFPQALGADALASGVKGFAIRIKQST
jgi:hypothetical protein